MTALVQKLLPIGSKLDSVTKKYLINTAEKGLSTVVWGYGIGQISGADPYAYSLACFSLHIARVTDGILCKAMLAKGEPSASKKMITFNASLLSGFLFFYKTMQLAGCASFRDEKLAMIANNGFASQIGAIIVFASTVLFASDHMNLPIMKKIQKAAIDAMKLRAEEIPFQILSSGKEKDAPSANISDLVLSNLKRSSMSKVFRIFFRAGNYCCF